MSPEQPNYDNPYMGHVAHRVLTALAWTLFAAGLLEWFVLGANRPADPYISGVVISLPVVVRSFLR